MIEEIFLRQNGFKILSGTQDYFIQSFDWQLTKSGLNRKISIPKTVCIKIDFLPLFVDRILPDIQNEFTFVSAYSDYSPEINFNREYNILINNPNLKFWFMNNLKTNHPKTISLPCGLGAGQFWQGCKEEEVDNFLINVRDKFYNSNKLNKVFCCFRDRNWNVCGDDMVIRPKIYDLIKDRTDIFDVYPEGSLDFKTFVETLSKYKYILCPHGNGMDPNPNAWLGLLVNTIPIVYETVNSISMFEDTNSVIYFKKFEDLLNPNIFQEREPVNFEFLTNNYWVDKIKNK